MAQRELKNEEMEALVGGYHSAPDEILGMHRIVSGDKESLVVRAFRPLDTAVFVLDVKNGRTTAMERIHPGGLFAAHFSRRKNAFAYRLLVEDGEGKQHELEDPYRFQDEWLSDFDLHLHGEGSFLHSFEKLGAHPRTVDGVDGVQFAVWAPNAERVSVIGPFNFWDDRIDVMRHRPGGVWELFLPNLPVGSEYKYSVKSRLLGHKADKTDPYGFFFQKRPDTASIVCDIDNFVWQDETWMDGRGAKQAIDQPINIYEVHLGSWKRGPEDNGFLGYRELAHDLVAHCLETGYTHLELLPITEHPYDGSWGYQVTGYFAPSSRFGRPEDFQYFVDYCHQHGIGVLLDWVPAHFPKDSHGLAFFDGTHLYEHEDPRVGEHKGWGTKIFNFGRNEVRNFLLSSALFWLQKYHIDGLRVDAVASMLYLDYDRDAGAWLPNRYGGRENLEAIDFIRSFNDAVHEYAPGTITIAEESTSWPMVSRPTYMGGLGFDYKWNMGWMHDTLQFFENEPIYRSFHHGTLTFSLLYAFSEKFLLPFSHDEVVHLKKSMLSKMPGDGWQKFANLRLLYGYQWSHPGKKLLFMGSEFGQWREWSEERSLDWHLLEQDPKHGQLQACLRRLNELYQNETALHEEEYSWEGFQWIDLHDYERSILSYTRRSPSNGESIQVILNFTPIVRHDYRVGVPQPGTYQEIFNSDSVEFGGSNVINTPRPTLDTPWQGQPNSIELTLPPLGVVFFKHMADE